jgi:LacI family transcriptional regulator
VSSWVVPRLTTVRQPLAEMAAMATRMVLTMAAGERIESPRVELATRLVVRESTAAPANAPAPAPAAAGEPATTT